MYSYVQLIDYEFEIFVKVKDNIYNQIINNISVNYILLISLYPPIGSDLGYRTAKLQVELKYLVHEYM